VRRDLKPSVNAKAVERRVRELELYMEAADDVDGDSNEEMDGIGEAEITPPQMIGEAVGSLSGALSGTQSDIMGKTSATVRAENRRSLAAVWEAHSEDDDDDQWTGKRVLSTYKEVSGPGLGNKLNKRRASGEDDSDEDDIFLDEAAVAPTLTASNKPRLRLLDDDDDE
jgi:hypothetical protein